MEAALPRDHNTVRHHQHPHHHQQQQQQRPAPGTNTAPSSTWNNTGNRRSEDANMRALFAALDKDRNGYIDKNELRDTMSEVGLELSERDLDTMMKAAGVAIKDRVFYEDFVRMMTGTIGQSQKKAVVVSRDAREPSVYSLCDVDDEDQALQAMRVSFAMFDQDGDGLISVHEVQDTMTSLGIKISLKEVKQIVRRVDVDCDGSISYDEFRQLMNKYQKSIDVESSRLESVAESGSSSGGGSGGQLPLVKSTVDQELHDAFQVFDKDQDGFLNAFDLRSTMSQLGLVLSEDDVHAMMKSVGIGPHGKISYNDFCKIYCGKASPDVESRLSSFQPNNKMSKQQETELHAVFDVFDVDRDGFITMYEVTQVLQSMNFQPSPTLIEDIFKQVDLDGNGKIDFREFLLLVHNYERPLPEDIEMHEMFNALDKDRNGFIDKDELKASFGDLGIPLTDADVAAMMSEADVHSDRIYYQDFVQMMTGKLHVTPSQVRLSNSCSSSRTVSATVSEDTIVSAGQQTTLHQQRVCAVAEARRRREANSTQHSNSNGRVKSHKPALQSGLSFEVQEFFRETSTVDPTLQNLSPPDISPVSPDDLSPEFPDITATAAVVAVEKPAVTACNDTRNLSHCNNSPKHSADKAPPSTWLAFKIFDRNSDGYISKLELHKTMNDLGIELSREDLDVMMLEADINKDGRIDYSEFSKLMKGSFETFAKQAASLMQVESVHTGNGSVVSGSVASPPSHRLIASTTATVAASSPARRRPPPPPPAAVTPRPPPVPPRPAPGTFPALPCLSPTPPAVQQSQGAVVAVTGLGFAAEDEMRAAFQVFDLDGDGLIDSHELRLTMSHLGENLTDRDVEAMIHAVDRNMDGKIDYEEFLLMLKGSK